MKWTVALFFLSGSLQAAVPARMGVFQQGPVGYAQAFLGRHDFEVEGMALVTRKSGEEDSPLTSLSGETKQNDLFAGGYVRMSEDFYFLFNAEASDLDKRYNAANGIYAFKSNAVNYTIESGAHFDKGSLQYGSKIAVRIFGEHTRSVLDTTGSVDVRYPEAELPFLKFWAALIGENSKLGLTIHTHNKKMVRPKSSSTTSSEMSSYGHSVLGEMWLDLSMRHSQRTVLAFGLHLIKTGQISESVQSTSNALLAGDRYQPLNKDQYELILGSEYMVANFLKIYSSVVYSLAGFADDKYASIIQDNTGGLELNSTLALSRNEHDYMVGLSYRRAEKIATVVPEDSATKPWAGIENPVSVGQVAWSVLFSMRTKI